MATSDDLKLIHGIGPNLERRLHGAGIVTFQRLADLSVDELETMVPGLSEKRHGLANWISEATKRAAESPQPDSASASAHFEATFQIELLLDEGGTVRNTKVTHLESGIERNWAGFEENKLVRFLLEMATGQAGEAESSQPLEAREAAADVEDADATEGAGPRGVLRLRELETSVGGESGASDFLQEGQPFTVRTVLDLTGLEARRQVPLKYVLGVYANGLVNGHRLLVGEHEGTISITDKVVPIEIEATSLPKDLYRLMAFVTVRQAGNGGSPPATLAATLDKGPLQVG
jgi:hypothetical protein